MIRKLIVFCVVLSFIVFGSVFGIEEFIRSAYAQEKKAASKKEVKEMPAKKKAEVAKEKAEEISLPDGTLGRRYDFVLTPENFIAPYKISIVSGELPTGFTINQKTRGIEGEPKQSGEWGLTIRVVDAKGKKGLFAGTIRVWRMLTVGEHGQFKGFDGLQMALNMAQDMDEIRIEKGVIEASGLVIPANKAWEHGIKISGGWNETYGEKGNKPEETTLDGGGKESRILTISNSKGRVAIENLMFTNSKGGAVSGGGTFTNCTFTNNSTNNFGVGGAVDGGGTFTNCTFTNNSAKGTGMFGGRGGAVSGDGMFINCIFTGNSAAWGGAVYGNGAFINCTFMGNSAERGGAVYGDGTFINCKFTNNSAGDNGGAVKGNGAFTNSTFMGNSAERGGAVYGGGTFINCKFTNNSAGDNGGAVKGNGAFTNSTFTSNSADESGGAVSGGGTFTNCTLYGNKAKEKGGAFSGGGKIINSIFHKNTAAEKDNDITVDGNLDIDYSLLNYLSGAANYGANNIMGDPKFVDPENDNLSLRPNSPAIDKGKLLPELKDAKDLDGKPRVVSGKIDMGAYEWQGKDVGEEKLLKTGEVFRTDEGGIIEIIFRNKLVIGKRGGETIAAEYDFKGDKMSVVFNFRGTRMVKYYLLTEKGLKDEETNEVFYSKAAVEKKAIENLSKEFVLVKGGCYQMGDTFGDGDADEKPVHEVCVDDFYMGKYEATQRLWATIMGSNPSKFGGCDNCPVEQVSWNDAQEFINKLNKTTGKKYRLPTEAEWEYAARSGGKSEKYAGDDDLDSVAWHKSNSEGKTHPVGQKKPNGLGLYDTIGNVWEWVQDWYDEDYYESSPKDNPRGIDSGQKRVVRGGSWNYKPQDLRASKREWNEPTDQDKVLGFRLVLSSQ